MAFLVSPLLAGEPRPDATIKNKSFEARIYLDDTVKADQALAADCLAEGRKWMEKNAVEAEGERKQDPQLFRDGGWTFERRYNFRSRRWPLCEHRPQRLYGYQGRASEFRRQYHRSTRHHRLTPCDAIAKPPRMPRSS